VVERLFGVETEYALAAIGARSQSLDRGPIVEALLHLAHTTLPSLPDEFSGGVFLQNGARFYVDAGLHPECTTPEVSNPWDAVRYVQAGELLLLRLATPVGAKRRAGQLLLMRCNVDYGGMRSTWGCHESYMHRADPGVMPKQIIPHLVSRLIYTGAGGFDNRSAGVDFLLSPRVAHMTSEVSGESTHNRGIFHTKDEPLTGGGYHRLHILCGESLCSELASWLKVGTTALVVAMIEAGLSPGDAVELRAPVAAMRAFAGDPTCMAAANCVRGKRLRAIDIQRHYLALAEAHVNAAFMPQWAGDVCQEWRAILDRLETGPQSVATTLDWSIKLALLREHVRRRGMVWESLSVWTDVSRRLAAALARTPQQEQLLTAELVLGNNSPVAGEVTRLAPLMCANGLSWTCFGPFLNLRQELFEIDTRFGQLGDAGIFTALDASGVLTHHVAGVDGIEDAIERPPDVPRARRRGELVRQLCSQKERYSCDWRGVWDHRSGRMVDLSDPFAASSEWKECSDDDLGSLRRLHARVRAHFALLRDRGRRVAPF
jgi:hypothetical protein